MVHTPLNHVVASGRQVALNVDRELDERTLQLFLCEQLQLGISDSPCIDFGVERREVIRNEQI